MRWSPGSEDTSSPHYAAISATAQQLHEEHAAWLNPPDVSLVNLRERTLTNLYNALNVFCRLEKIRIKKPFEKYLNLN